MSTNISELKNVTGFVGACLVDSETGLMLESESSRVSFDLEAAAAANTEVVRSKNAAMKVLGLDHDHIEDILITLGTQLHLIRPLTDNPSVFLYLALDRQNANLGMARLSLRKVEGTLKI
ncbi:roadblock/LC7 domain-containing protein [Celeribacter litoreus]|uniref:roadblock/LC7 domain-containing protein n=1 Tax=Celeribacter litoreus TaxID=2876714 RepID=UPI001CCB3B2B|nr:roadblock/LC7 domain-containing protein [Celeribacter litoreus]MCA0044678.1 roadblock/LC7 domain-containing protein [Celeribacter litoreus]